MSAAGRALVLVPDDAKAGELREWFEKTLGWETFNARAIESSKDRFLASANVVAILANRYDGIDLPGDDCRVLILEGLPSATHAQERFFVERLGASALLNDRILTRVTQAFGRCTRSSTDYAAVVVLGEKLHQHLLKRDRRQFMHPELQAELEFGLEQSREATIGEFREYIRAFLAQDEEWEAANEQIVSKRQLAKQANLPGTAELRSAVRHEVEYNMALWNSDFGAALEGARRVLSSLTVPELRGYRALWSYLAGSAAKLAADAGNLSLEAVARDYFRQAAAASQGIPWLHEIGRRVSASLRIADPAGWDDMLVEGLEVQLQRLGIVHDGRYDTQERVIAAGINGTDVTAFEVAHAALGELLGFRGQRGEGQGAPDAWWILDDTLCIVFEDHSGALETSSLDVKKARQAVSHPNWIVANVAGAKNAQIVPVLVSPVRKVDRDAHPHVGELRYWRLDDFRTWTTTALAAIREVRRTFGESGDVDWRAAAAEVLRRYELDPKTLLEKVLKKRVNELTVS